MAASVSDKADAKLLAARLAAMFGTLKLTWADACYSGKPLRVPGATVGITNAPTPIR